MLVRTAGVDAQVADAIDEEDHREGVIRAVVVAVARQWTNVKGEDV